MEKPQDWKWYSGSSEEVFTNGPFETRDEAAQNLEGFGGFVIEAYKSPLHLSNHFYAESLLEDAEEDVSELADEDGSLIFLTTKEQEIDLQAKVRAAIDEWQKAHGLTFIPWCFSSSRNLERIEPEEAEIGADSPESDAAED